jgi:hypothetical protein
MEEMRVQHGDVLTPRWLDDRHTFEHTTDARFAALEARIAELERLL